MALENDTTPSAPANSSTGLSQPTNGASNSAGSNGATDVTSPDSRSNDPTNKTDQPGTTGQNWEQEYKRIVSLREQEQKNYNALRQKLISQGTEKNTYEKQVGDLTAQVKTLAEAFAKATKQPYDPEQFMETLKTQGPQFIEQLIAEREKQLSESFQKQNSELSGKMRKMQVAMSVKDRRADSANYPEFGKLEATMSDIMIQLRADFKAGLLPTDPDTVDPDELTDYLYNLARLQHSQDAIKAAEAEGARKAGANLAREAETSVAGGGKNVSSQVPNLDKLSLAEERDYWVKKVGLAD